MNQSFAHGATSLCVHWSVRYSVFSGQPVTQNETNEVEWLPCDKNDLMIICTVIK